MTSQSRAWSSISLLVKEDHISEASEVLNVMLERAFTRMQLPASIIEGYHFPMPDLVTIEQLQELDIRTHSLLQQGDYRQAFEIFTNMLWLISELAQRNPSDIVSQIFAAQYESYIKQQPHEIERIQSHLDIAFIQGETAVGIEPQFYSSGETAVRLGLSAQSIRRLCEAGRFPGAYQTDGKHWRIPQSAFRTTEEQDATAKKTLEQLDRIASQRGERSNTHVDLDAEYDL